MPISAIVVTLSSDPEAQAQALEILGADPRLTLGEIQNTQLPVVVDSETMSEGIRLVNRVVPDVPGVTFVQVVSVDFSDTDFSEKQNQYEPRKRARGGKS